MPDGFHDFDGKHVFLPQRFENILQQDLLAAIVLVGKHRNTFLRQLLHEYTVYGRARSAGFEAAALAAPAYHLVVEQREMAELARESRPAIEQFAVNDQPDAQTPAGIDEYHRILVVTHATHVLPVGHRPGIVLDIDLAAQAFLQQHRERLLLDKEIAVTVPGLGIDPPREVEADRKNLGTVDLALGNEPVDHVAQPVERLHRIFHDERHAIAHVDDLPLEIDDRQSDDVLLDVDTDEITCIRVQSVDVGPAPSGSALFPEIVHEALFDQFADQFGDRRHRQVHFMAQIRDTEIPSHDVVSDQLQFQQSGFIAFFGLSQKRIDHNSQ